MTLAPFSDASRMSRQAFRVVAARSMKTGAAWTAAAMKRAMSLWTDAKARGGLRCVVSSTNCTPHITTPRTPFSPQHTHNVNLAL